MAYVRQIVNHNLDDDLLASASLLSTSRSEICAKSRDFVGGVEPGEGGNVGHLSSLRS